MDKKLSDLTVDEITAETQTLGLKIDDLRQQRLALQDELRARHARAQALRYELAALECKVQ